jgi:DNA primase catalytic core
MYKISQACQFLLHNYPGAQEAKSYLNHRLSTPSQEKFQFGYFPPIKELSCLSDQVGMEYLTKLELIYHKQIEDSTGLRNINFSYFENHPLTLPFKDQYGKVIALVNRSLLSEEERKQKNIIKYKNTVFKKGNYLFGLFENKQAILNKAVVYLVEGQFDVIKAYEKGIDNVVALGSSYLTAYQFGVISRYTDNLILLLDNDEAGEKGRMSAKKKFGEFANIQNFYIPPPYKDIDEYLTALGDEEPSFVVKN